MAIASATKDIAVLEDFKTAQDAIKCDLCPNSVELHCKRCDVRLCGTCVSKHVSKIQNSHEIVSFVSRKSEPSFPVCQFHLNTKCEFHCQTCYIAVCSKCITTGHKFHKIVDLMEIFKSKLDSIQQSSDDLEMVCLPKFQNILSHSELRLSTIATEYQILKSAIKKHGQDMHRIVDVVTKRFEDEAEKMEHESMTELKNHISETRRSIEEMHSLIEENKRLMLSNDVGKALSYDADIERYRKGKQEIRASVPDFKRVSLTTDELCCLFGSLKTPEKEGFIEKNIIKDTGKDNLPRVAKEFLLMPSISATIDSGSDHVQRVCCQETDEVWVSGNGSVITRVDMEGNVREILHTSSGYVPHDLGVTEPGELLYCDSTEKTIIVVQNGKQRALLQYQNWRPMGIAVTVAGEIIVSLYSDLEGCSKVITYCLGRNEEQGQETLSLERLQPKLRKVIQYDERGENLYRYATFVAENGVNNDICVSDHGTNTVVVVNHEGKFRFVYHNILSQRKYDTFFPCSIVTDSQGHILIADGDNDCIHVIDCNRQFLCYIDNCNFAGVCGIDIDFADKLWIGEVDSGKIKVVEYLQLADE